MWRSLRAVSKHRALQPFEGSKPSLGTDIFVAPNASVIGNVRLGDQSSVWYGAVLRGAHVPSPNPVSSPSSPHRNLDLETWLLSAFSNLQALISDCFVQKAPPI